jgi:hypothetical protein
MFPDIGQLYFKKRNVLLRLFSVSNVLKQILPLPSPIPPKMSDCKSFYVFLFCLNKTKGLNNPCCMACKFREVNINLAGLIEDTSSEITDLLTIIKNTYLKLYLAL